MRCIIIKIPLYFVKNSFNKVYSEYINPSNWSQLNERLERDTIRGEIVYQFLRFRKNIMKVGVLALVLLLSKTCVYNNLTTTSSEITIFAENHDVKTDENKTYTQYPSGYCA